MPRQLPQASEDDLLLRLNESTRHVKELDLLVSPKREENFLLSNKLTSTLINIQNQISKIIKKNSIGRRMGPKQWQNCWIKYWRNAGS